MTPFFKIIYQYTGENLGNRLPIDSDQYLQAKDLCMVVALFCVNT